MRHVCTILSAILVIACGIDDQLPTGPSIPSAPLAAPPGSLSVFLEISGDASTGQAVYGMTLDGVKWYDALPGSNRFNISSGMHTVALAPFVSFFSTPHWCFQTAANSFSGAFSAATPTTVTFSVECPPLTGTGTLQLRFEVSGSAAPTEMAVRLLRLNGETLSSSYTIPTNKPIDISLPVGLYRIGVVTGAACKWPAIYYLAAPVRAVYQSKSASMWITFSCN